jgi:hypothetical protein
MLFAVRIVRNTQIQNEFLIAELGGKYSHHLILKI